jgi:hypothetical protein
MSKHIIYPIADNDVGVISGHTLKGSVSVLTPANDFMNRLDSSWTEEQKLIHIANKDLPTGQKYDIVEKSDLPTSNDFRNAWEYVASASEKTSEDLSDEDKLKYNKMTQEEYDDANPS